MSKRTKGKWTVGKEEAETGDTSIVCGELTWGIATVYGTGNEQARANARLIAAAPALLEACERVSKLADDILTQKPESTFAIRLHQIIDAAIAQATE